MISQKDIVEKWGLSKGTVSKLVKRGMPLDSLESASRWRDANVRGYGHLPQADAKIQRDSKPVVPKEVQQDEESDDISDVLRRAKQTEKLAYRMVVEAYKAGNINQFKGVSENHARAVGSRIKAEQELLALKRGKGDLLTMDEAVERFGRILQGLRSMLDSAPKTLGARCNPADPDLARLQIELWVEQVLRGIANEKA